MSSRRCNARRKRGTRPRSSRGSSSRASRRVWVELRLAYWVAQVGNADALNHRRVAKDGWRAGEGVEDVHTGAKKNRRDVDADFVEEASVQERLDGVTAVDANGLSAGGGLGLLHGAFNAVGHEVDS